VARVIAREQVSVRKPEQGTKPKLFYVGADEAALTPALQQPGARTLWGGRTGPAAAAATTLEAAGAWTPPSRPIPRPVEALGRTVYDVDHDPRPWGWRVAAYLWTKSIAAGAALMGVAGVVLDWPGGGGVSLPLVALVFLLLTTILLVVDLKRPDRFHYILLNGAPSS
jgi:hypothetical protein